VISPVSGSAATAFSSAFWAARRRLAPALLLDQYKPSNRCVRLHCRHRGRGRGRGGGHGAERALPAPRGSRNCGSHPAHLTRICACDAEDAGAAHGCVHGGAGILFAPNNKSRFSACWTCSERPFIPRRISAPSRAIPAQQMESVDHQPVVAFTTGFTRSGSAAPRHSHRPLLARSLAPPVRCCCPGTSLGDGLIAAQTASGKKAA
jgi:hypothetical protein